MINANLVIVHTDLSLSPILSANCAFLHAGIARVLCHSPVAGGMEQIISLYEAVEREIITFVAGAHY